MRDISDMNRQALPSGKQLLLSMLIALVVAVVVLITAVLPAEYGIDPSGLGKRIGLIQLYQADNTINKATAPTAQNSTESGQILGDSINNSSDQTLDEPPSKTTDKVADKVLQKRPTKWLSDNIKLTLLPKQGMEVKAHIEQGNKMLFHWEVSEGTVSFDMHGNVINAAENDFTSYWLSKGETQSAGTFTAPFSGLHGWYWENETDLPITIKLTTEGYYQGLVTH